MGHSIGCCVRLPTHDGGTLRVDRLSSRVVEKHDARSKSAAAPDVFLIGYANGFPVYEL
jgi:hypothetical protein